VFGLGRERERESWPEVNTTRAQALGIILSTVDDMGSMSTDAFLCMQLLCFVKVVQRTFRCSRKGNAFNLTAPAPKIFSKIT